MKNITCVILAAGLGTRMKSSIPKPLHKIHSRPMLEYLMNTVKEAGLEKIVLVLGHRAEEIKAIFKGCDSVIQPRQRGSADALNCTRKYLQNHSGDVLLLYSDVPLLKKETLEKLIDTHRQKKYGCTLLTATINNPGGYGRIIRNESGEIIKVIEDKDATLHEEIIEEVNLGVYVFKKEIVFSHIDKVKLNQSKKEYYLTDIINILKKSNITIGTVSTDDITEAVGINSRVELAEANDIARERALRYFMEQGVTVRHPQSTYIDLSAKMGKDTVVYANTIIERDVKIGDNCKIGPFAHLRPGTEIDSGVEIGNFVELVRTKVGKKCKIKHKTYLGDAVLGDNINVGAGTITANFDGKNKSQTVIGNNAFIGVGCILIAPVKIGKNAIVGAGSVVTKGHDVPDGATVIGIPAKIFKKQ